MKKKHFNIFYAGESIDLLCCFEKTAWIELLSNLNEPFKMFDKIKILNAQSMF